MDAIDDDVCYRALATRDARFDGEFFTAVKTTKIYCRPICPARTPRRENCTFYPSAAAAQSAGYRPCLRCRPELAPGLAGTRGTSNTIARALRLIDEGALDDGDVEALGDRLGVSDRHLRRLFDEHVGAAPIVVARARRALFAKRLLADTALPIAEIAFASGFSSIRRFNDEIRATYGRAPRELRKSVASTNGTPGVTLSLAYRPPYDFASVLAFLGPRAIPGVEEVTASSYRRAFAIGAERGLVTVRPSPTRDSLIATIESSGTTSMHTIVARLRALFDLDAEPITIGAHLSLDPALARLVARRPGLRVPGAWDPFELGVRAILGQQVSVAAATTFAGRIVARHGASIEAADGAPSRLFPDPATIAEGDLEGLGLTGGRIRALRSYARYFAEHRALPSSLDAILASLCALEGLGPWTASYVAMRAGAEPDAFPASDLGLARAYTALAGVSSPPLDEAALAWRPWRAYAAMHLWASLADVPAKPNTTKTNAAKASTAKPRIRRKR